MYGIFYFRGGVYKFDELVEYIEDVGGMILRKDCFELIRGDYYLSTEVHVLIVVPEEEIENTKSLIDEIKGVSDDVEITEEQKKTLLAYLSIYDSLNKTDTWTKEEHIKDTITCPCYALLCNQLEDEECQLDSKLEQILKEMCANGVIEYNISADGKSEYRLKKID
ncbi:methyl-coenzyme M reductase family protein [Methanobacterium sp.]|uniref:methyl-coenzyme M reductase family protein n=1 Tax=Methanobacterium sp. TaxID=2164 RepID=UPI003C787EC6